MIISQYIQISNHYLIVHLKYVMYISIKNAIKKEINAIQVCTFYKYKRESLVITQCYTTDTLYCLTSQEIVRHLICPSRFFNPVMERETQSFRAQYKISAILHFPGLRVCKTTGIGKHSHLICTCCMFLLSTV